MRDYTELPDVEIAETLLEESYVLHVEATPGQFVLSVSFALTDKHPAYEPPGPDEYLCYRRGVMVFSGVTRLVWDHQDVPPSYDATGEVDYGHIDVLRFGTGTFVLDIEGMGIELHAASISVALLPDAPG